MMKVQQPAMILEAGGDLEARSGAAWRRLFADMGGVVTDDDPPLPFVADAARLFQRDDAQTVLDVGCGDGRNLLELARTLPLVVGVDCSPDALRGCQARLAAAVRPRNWALITADVLGGVPMPADHVDGAFCGDLLGHLVDPAAALAGIARVLRPGATLVGNLFSLGDSTRGGRDLVPLGGESYLLADRFFMRFFGRADAEALLDSVGEGQVDRLELAAWTEPPHRGYREYEHGHESWVFAWRKRR